MRTLPVLCLAFLVGCNSGGGGDDPAGTGDGVFGRVTAAGQGLSGARITIGGASTTTDAEGRYQLATSAGPTVVTIEAPAHVINVQRLAVGGATALDVALLPEAPAQPLDATAGGMIVGERGAQVLVPPAGLVGPDGAAIEGQVAVHLTPIDPAIPEQLAAAPGDFEARTRAGAPAQLESFGMLDVTIRQGDATLQVAPGEQLTIRIPAPMAQVELPPTVPLWSFDEAQGLWIEEGELTLDAASGTYEGAISHMSVWNADKPLETTCVRGTVVDADTGAPIAGARVQGRGTDYLGVDSTTTAADGRFAVLVRIDSAVSIAAYHADGGGEIRSVQSGSAIAPQPVTPDDDSCVDGGTWTVRRGEVTFDAGAGGGTVQCEADVFEQIGIAQCVPLLAELARCHQPVGECTQEGLLDIRYANGAGTRTDFGDGGRIEIEFLGPGGVVCGTQIIDASAGGGSVQLVLADGRQATYGVEIDSAAGGITYVCADGSRRSLSARDQQRIEACNGGNTDSCAPGDGGFGMCEGEADCGDGQVCCGGFCLARSACGLASCDAETDCGAGNVCCPIGNRCVAEADCVRMGWCGGDADCSEGQSCCDGRCENRPFCAGACQADGDCEEGICCDNRRDLTWCAADAEACYRGAECATDAECGDPATMTCCDSVCETWTGCYDRESCADQAACGGADSPLECCEREGTFSCEERVMCAAFRVCDAETPCGAGTQCCNNPAFVDGDICLPPELCFVNQRCADDGDCGPLDCCAIPGQEAEPICIEDCPEEWRP